VSSSENHIATVEAGLTGEQFLARMEAMSKKGKLAGFERGGPEGADAQFAAHGNPFDGLVLVRAADGRADFELFMPRKMPVIFAVILALTVWPGLPITDSFLYGFVWYERLMGMAGWLDTWVWYLPLTVIPAPFMLRSVMRKSRTAAMEHARETVERVKAALAG
jgi:hypothetical protein